MATSIVIAFLLLMSFYVIYAAVRRQYVIRKRQRRLFRRNLYQWRKEMKGQYPLSQISRQRIGKRLKQ